MSTAADDQPPSTSRPKFRSRDDDEGLRRIRQDQVAFLLTRLGELAEQTDPFKGDQSARGKDEKAFAALHWAGRLVDEVAGWAVDHAVGKAAAGQDFVRRPPGAAMNHPEYLEAADQADRHDHEEAGGRLHDPHGTAEWDPAVARTIVLNLARANSGAFPYRVARMLADALIALDGGDTLPLLQANDDPIKKVRYRRAHAKLRAMEHVEYRYRRGLRKGAAIHEVIAEYPIGFHGYRSWEKDVRKDLGNLVVAARLSIAGGQGAQAQKDAAFAEMGRLMYGPDALKADAANYKLILAVDPEE